METLILSAALLFTTYAIWTCYVRLFKMAVRFVVTVAKEIDSEKERR